MLLLGVGQSTNRVLNDNDCAVNDDAEVQCPQAHQVGTDLVGEHTGKGKQHGQRNHHGGDQRGPNVTQEQEEDSDNQNRPLNQVLLHRRNRFFNQVGTVVNRDRLDALW